LNKDKEYEDPSEKDMDQVYCFPSFLRQGKHIYVVAVPDEDGNPEYFSHRIIVR
jgi:hypothetical protein